MGVVYKARDAHTGRFVALKVVLDTQSKPERLDRFRREGQIAASLDHPKILRIHGAGQLQGMPYLAYELVEGCRPLNEAFVGQSLRDRVALVRDVARGLGFAHAKSVVHRDIKPDNLLVDGQGRVRIADFGLATAQDVERLTQTGALLGTPNYMAPEQFDSSSGELVGPHSDVWSLGVVLYEALTGELPFDAPTLFELAARINSGSMQRPRAINKEIPAAFESVCLCALAVDPSARYANGVEFADDLERALGGESVEARGYIPLSGWVQRAPWLLAPACAIGVAVAIAVLYEPSQPTVAVAPVVVEAPPAPDAEDDDDDWEDDDDDWDEDEDSGAQPSVDDLANDRLPKGKGAGEQKTIEGLIAGVEDWAEAEGVGTDTDEGKGLYLLHKGRAMKSFDMHVANMHYREAAEFGNAEAMRLLAQSLRDGKGCEPNPTGAFKWFVRGAEGGDVSAMHSTADMLVSGKHVSVDKKRGFAWFLKAAELGHRDSMVRVFREYRDGTTLEKNPEEARFWFDAAVAKGWKPKKDKRPPLPSDSSEPN